ncbi:Putative aminoacrylate hydrolase RutD [Geodia barretti]|uniref:Aminoacrylate hydrolase RutD n=1 Tax=Geodia barretti TaxID=519541 RepID=A0AA35XHG5_GEOBA|nr:Putative aminoacrylate hydrolase RutD [Geodia barretti]
MPFYTRGDVTIHYEEQGSGFPLLCTPGGGLSSVMSGWPRQVIDAFDEFKNDFRCITMDQRNASGGQSTGPVQVEDPWGAFADDQLGLMDHLGIDQFMFIGFCIGGPFAMTLIKNAPQRVRAAVLCQPVGHAEKTPDAMYDSGMDPWGPALCEQRDGLTMDTVQQYLHNLYRIQPDFMYSVDRDFARACQTPLLVMPDDTPSHSLQAAMDMVALAPNAQVTAYPWKEEPGLKATTIEQVRGFLKTHEPVAAAR